MVLRQSLKFILASYLLCLAVVIGIFVLWQMEKSAGRQAEYIQWLFLLPGVLLIMTMVRHVQRRLTKLTVLDDRLRYEAGLLSKTTRTMELAKVQDVRVDQSLMQRIFSLGDLSLETAGETSRIEIEMIDNPQGAADRILEMARAQRPQSGPPGAPPPHGL